MARASATDVKMGGAFVKIFGDDSALGSALRGAGSKVKAFSQNIQKIGMSMMKTAAIGAAPLLAGLQAQVDFSKQAANVSTMLSGADMKFMPEFSAGMKSLSVEFGESTETISKGLYDILSASVPPAQALDVLQTSMQAAAAGMTDTGVAADAITTILNSYKLSADEAGNVSDFLFAVVKRGKTTFAELAPSIGMVASTASIAGIKLDEVGAMLATMTRNGVQTRVAVTALNSIISGFAAPTDQAAAAAKKYGFELSTTTLKSIGLKGVLEKMQGMSLEQIAEIFPNIRAIRGIGPAIQDLTGFIEDLSIMQNKAGLTAEAFEKHEKTLAFRIKQVKQAIIALFRDGLGSALVPMTIEALTWIKELVIGMAEWLQENKKLVKFLAKTIFYIGAVGLALKALGIVLGMVNFIILLGPLGAIITGVGLLTIALRWVGNELLGIKDDANEATAAIDEMLDQEDKVRKRMKAQKEQRIMEAKQNAEMEARTKKLTKKLGLDSTKKTTIKEVKEEALVRGKGPLDSFATGGFWGGAGAQTGLGQIDAGPDLTGKTLVDETKNQTGILENIEANTRATPGAVLV